MVDKRRYNAKLNAKGLEKVLTEEQAGRFCRNQGTGGLFIVRAHAGPKVVGEDGSETINLIPDEVEFVPATHEDLVARFQRALYLARPDQFGQQAFEGTTAGEPKVDDTARELDAAVETDDKGEPTGVWSGDPDAPVPAGEREGEGPWPGDADYVAPGEDPAPDPEPADEVSKKRAGRKTAQTKAAPDAPADPAPAGDEGAERLAQARAALGDGDDAQSDG